MLNISRQSGESFYVYPDYSKISPLTTIGELFGDNGHITISIKQINKTTAKLGVSGIDEIDQFAIMRQELEA